MNSWLQHKQANDDEIIDIRDACSTADIFNGCSSGLVGLADNCQTLTVRGDNCQRGQLSEDQLSEETVRTFSSLGQL